MLAAIRELMKPSQSRHRGIGFGADLGEKRQQNRGKLAVEPGYQR
jgi:hypothetical protein